MYSSQIHLDEEMVTSTLVYYKFRIMLLTYTPFRYYQPTASINTESISSESQNPTEFFGNHVPGVQSDITSTKISSPDTSMTAFCQLVSWRLGADRAMIR